MDSEPKSSNTPVKADLFNSKFMKDVNDYTFEVLGSLSKRQQRAISRSRHSSKFEPLITCYNSPAES